MKTVHVTLKTQGQSPPQLAVFAQSIAAALESNENFPNLYPGVLILQARIKELNTAIVANKPGDKLSTSTLNSAVMELKKTLKAIAAHVEYACNNDQNIALSSGFKLKELVQRSAQGFVIEYGEHSGTVDLKCPHVKNAGYIWEYIIDAADSKEWTVAGNSIKAKFSITGLMPGTKYWFRVSTFDKNGQHPPCDPIMVMVI